MTSPNIAHAEHFVLVRQLLELLGEDASSPAPRRLLQEALTRRAPGTIRGAAWPLLDAIWASEASARTITHADTLPRVAQFGWAARVSVWHGDITALAAGAIVNAANSELTGCYVPMHRCVDNAIHTAAGPRLREECGHVMSARRRPEPAGTATATGGYFLPARHVLHTVGPIVLGGAPSPTDEHTLGRCYAGCLDAATRLTGADSVAFPGISTGMFGYPPLPAARVALASIRAAIEHGAAPAHVVLVTHTDKDRAAVSAAIEEVCRA